MKPICKPVAKPIIYSDGNVEAILADHKRQTRRLTGLEKINEDPDAWNVDTQLADGTAVFNRGHGLEIKKIRCPYGVAGDFLWIRETWRMRRLNAAIGGIAEFADVQFKAGWGVKGYREDWKQFYAHELSRVKTWTPTDTGDMTGEWKRSFFLRRDLSRITQRVASARPARLQDISIDDAVAEGIDFAGARPGQDVSIDGEYSGAFILSKFRSLWDGIYANAGHAWARNEWVWVVRVDAWWLENVGDVLARSAA